MSNIIVDSSILIDFLRGRSEAVAFISAPPAGQKITLHVVVAAELLQGVRDAREQRSIDGFLLKYPLLTLSESDSLTALDLLRRFRLSHGIGWQDCLIAATCIRLNAPLATRNVKHFSPIPDLQLLRPY